MVKGKNINGVLDIGLVGSINSWFCYVFSLIFVGKYVMLYYYVLVKVGFKFIERLRFCLKFL